MRKAFEPSNKGAFCGEHTFYFTKSGIDIESVDYSGHYSWDVVKRVGRSSGMILIFIGAMTAFLFPEDQLDDPEAFYKNILQSLD